MSDRIERLIQAALPGLTQLRHDLHEHPELGYEEERTSARILSELQELPGLSIRTGVAETGVVATLGADKPGPCVALRADMDALPIQEQSDRSYASKVPGKMHACGHDGHVTCLVGAARVLTALADELPGPVKFVFQPAEEGGAGGRRMCEEGVLADPEVTAIFGLHGWPTLKIGEIALRPGPVLASSDKMEITVRGRGAHAAFPHQGIDPIVIASHVIVALQTVVSRTTDPLDSAVVTVARVVGGSGYNIIPPQVELAGTVRTLNSRTRQRIHRRIAEVAEGTASALGGGAEVEIFDGYPVLENDPVATDFVERTVAEAGAGISFQSMDPVMGGEDFAFYAQRIPAAFYALGVCPAGVDQYPHLHQPNYDFSDGAIPHGVRMHVEVARRFRDNWPRS